MDVRAFLAGALQLLALAAIVLVLFAWPVFAADGTTVDLSSTAALLGEYLTVAIEVLVAAAIGWGLRWLHLSGNATAESLAAQLRDFLHGTAERALDRALAAVGEAVAGIDVRSAVIASALDYLQANAGDAVARLGASPDDLRRLLEAKLAARPPDPSAPS